VLIAKRVHDLAPTLGGVLCSWKAAKLQVFTIFGWESFCGKSKLLLKNIEESFVQKKFGQIPMLACLDSCDVSDNSFRFHHKLDAAICWAEPGTPDF
jgi:hypothetical protein